MFPKKTHIYIYICTFTLSYVRLEQKHILYVFNSKAPKLGKFVVLHKSLVFFQRAKCLSFESRVSGATNFHGRNVTRRLSP